MLGLHINDRLRAYSPHEIVFGFLLIISLTMWLRAAIFSARMWLLNSTLLKADSERALRLSFMIFGKHWEFYEFFCLNFENVSESCVKHDQ